MGSTVTNVGFLRGLNNDGEIAFVYQLADGRQGVALAVPEPGSAVVFGAAAVAACNLRRRRGRVSR